jgi:beta-lactamase class A
MTTRFAVLLVVFLGTGGAALGDEPTLKVRIEPLAKGHKGRVAVAVKHLTTGESFTLNADEVMPTASLIKLPIMVEVYQQAADGKVKLTDAVNLKEADKVPGSGILTMHFSDGASFPLRDAVRLMIAYSDNTATNLVLDKIGIRSVNERMGALGLKETRLNAKVFRGSTTSVDPERSKKYGLGSTTANEMVALLEKLHAGELVSKDVCKAMREHMLKCDDKLKFPKLLPAAAVVAHKTGSVNDARTDAGIIETPSGPVALCVLTAGNEDKRWTNDNAGDVLCAKVAKAVYDHFAAKKK